MFHSTPTYQAANIGRRSMLAAMASTCMSVWAAWPDRPVRIIVPWPGGGIVDLAARLVFNQVQSFAGQPFIIDNRIGAGGALGASAVAKAARDGNTLCVTTSAICINQALGINQPFDVIKDFEPIALLGTAPVILVVTPGKGIKSVDDLIKLARSKPGQVTFASAGNGSPAHLAGEWMKTAFGVDMVHVPYKGAPAAMIDQMAGLVDYHFSNATVALPQIRAGKVIPIAVGSPRPLSYIPDVPTMQSAGVPGFDCDQWLGLLGPAGMPNDIVGRLAQEVGKALNTPEVRTGMDKNGIVAADAAGTPQSFQKVVAGDLERWIKVVKTANIKVE
jgi:tripartite-type tricarboxylate transporter receptor subunit TctC